MFKVNNIVRFDLLFVQETSMSAMLNEFPEALALVLIDN